MRFHQIDSESGSRVKQKRVSDATGEEVPYENIVKGYEIGPDRYVTITPEELDSLQPKKTRTIDIEDFVDLDQIDPIYYDHPYYLVPDTGAEKAYRLLLRRDGGGGQGGHRTGRAPLEGEPRRHPPAERACSTMETMLFADEVMLAGIARGGPGRGKEDHQAELEMAQQLIESLSSDFEPDKYRDEYRDSVLEMIERKAQGEEIVVEAAEEEPQKVPDLMAALEASIAAAKARAAASASRRPRRAAKAKSGNGQASAVKRATAKSRKTKAKKS